MKRAKILDVTSTRWAQAAALSGWLCAGFALADDFQGATHLMPFDEEKIGRAHV